MTKKILVLAGDGIGPEVTAAAEQVLRVVLQTHSLGASFSHALVGGACYDVTGEFITDQTMQLAHGADAILFGSEGGPEWDDLELAGKPESRSGLIRLRRELDLFANLRPIRALDALLERSTFQGRRHTRRGLHRFARVVRRHLFRGAARHRARRRRPVARHRYPGVQRVGDSPDRPRRFFARQGQAPEADLRRQGERHGKRRALAPSVSRIGAEEFPMWP